MFVCVCVCVCAVCVCVYIYKNIYVYRHTYLMQFFHGKVKLISSQHHFRYSSDNAGVMQHKTYPEMALTTTKLFQPGVSVADVLSTGCEGSRFRDFSAFVLAPTPIRGKRLKACQEVVDKYPGFLGDGKRFYSPCIM